VAYSTRERISHVYRRLGFGGYPDLIESTNSVDDAIARSLDLDQQARHDNMMAQLNAALDGFWKELDAKADNVLVLTASEFGRRPGENGSGTDHGTAAAHMLTMSDCRFSPERVHQPDKKVRSVHTLRGFWRW